MIRSARTKKFRWLSLVYLYWCSVLANVRSTFYFDMWLMWLSFASIRFDQYQWSKKINLPRCPSHISRMIHSKRGKIAFGSLAWISMHIAYKIATNSYFGIIEWHLTHTPSLAIVSVKIHHSPSLNNTYPNKQRHPRVVRLHRLVVLLKSKSIL